ncbi:hypothetical protein NJH78_26050 [Pseudomonas chlororaphis]|uniref:hypothetical protein n=1 Tax=Pseudomonas chlororaphis TaxID=587753 RepID=UPI00209ADE8D|nr:hypothetical protein [Pseudomonas chlororaphis]MCO7573457.1 hypothetical protein [Pseudomonas chlororaphis]MCO7591332.1 hypothetical protein [Pseudomonas chlororaphis]
MDRKTKQYLDEIYFWQKARARLLEHAAQLREPPPGPLEPALANAAKEPLDDLLHSCGLDTLRRDSEQAASTDPGAAGSTPPTDAAD